MHFFISYAKKDTYNLAKQLHDELTQLPGITAWMDELLRSGRSWASQIEREVDRCDYVIVLLSPDVRRDPDGPNGRSFVLNEIDYAVQEHKPIIPVMAQTTGVPVQLAGIQYINFARNPDMGMQQLIKEINLMMGADSKLPLPEDSLPPHLSPSFHGSQSPPEADETENIVASSLWQTDLKSSKPAPKAKRPDQTIQFLQSIPKNIGYLITAIQQRFRPSRPAKRSASRSMRSPLLTILMFGLMGGVIVLLVGFIGITSWYNNIIEPYRARILVLEDYNPAFQTVQMYDANGDLIAELNNPDNGAKVSIPLEQMSPFIVHAVMTQVDPYFYDAPDTDFLTIIRFFIQYQTEGEIESDASNMAQEIARTFVLQDTVRLSDPALTEILVTHEIANRYDKNFLLEFYLNETYFGNQSYGVEAASQLYFDHGAEDLNYAESALLASIIPAPAIHDPVINRSTAISGMEDLMLQMLDVGCIQFQYGDWFDRGSFCITPDTQVTYNGSSAFLVRVDRDGEINGGLANIQRAAIEVIDFKPRSSSYLQYPHFVNFVQAEIESEFGTNAMYQRGFNIYTTLNPTLQDAAQEALNQQVENLATTGVDTGTVMVTDPTTGAIRAMVGSPDFTDQSVAGQVNQTQTYQQASDVMKPIVYAAALAGQDGRDYLTTASLLWDVPVTYRLLGETYTPMNYDGLYHGAVPLRYALQNDYNIAAVKAYEFIGNERFIDMAQALGLGFVEGSTIGLPSALGANDVRLIDMMKVYGTFANGGERNDLYAIDRIMETVDDEAVAVFRSPYLKSEQVISPQLAYLMTNILSDDNARTQAFGSDSYLTLASLGKTPSQNHVAAKTGTSDEGRDLWTIGYTKNVVVGVWMGTSDNSPTMNTTGFLAAAPVWNVVMEAALARRTAPEFENPGSVITQEVCRTTGTLSYGGCPQRTIELFIQDKRPPAAGEGLIQTLEIDSWTGRLANEFCQDNVIEQTLVNIDDHSAVEWLNTTNEGRAYAQILGVSIPLQTMPTESCSLGQTLPTFNINYPDDNQTVSELVTILGQVSANDFSQYQLKYASAEDPENFTMLASSTSQAISNSSLLGEWDTTVVPNGDYIIRLLADSSTGGFAVVDVSVHVDNLLPTATPTTD